METPYARVTEIREAMTSEEANRWLDDGFVLIKAVEKRETDAIGRQTTGIVYILGALRGNRDGRPARPAKTEQIDIMHRAPDVDPTVLENRPWKKYDNGEGEWTFTVNKDGLPVAELASAKDFLEALEAGEDLVVNGYRYRLRGKFLKRYPVNGQSA